MMRCSANAEMPFFLAHTNHMAENQEVNGSRERWNTVPAVTEVLRRHDAHSHSPVPVRHESRLPHAGHTNPSGHRSRVKYAVHASSSGNQRCSSGSVDG